MQRFMQTIVTINYWMLVLLPFSAAIAPGFANTVIGIAIGTFLTEKLLKREKPVGVKLELLLFGIFILIGLLSFVNSVDWHASFKGITKLLKALMIFLVYSQQVRSLRHFKLIAIACACAVILTGIDAVWQLFTGRDFIRGNALYEAIGLPRATAAFPGCNAMGIFMAAFTTLIFGLALFSARERSRFWFIIAAVLGSIGVGLSLSRGAGIGLFSGVLILSVARKSKVMIVGLVLLLVVFPFVLPQNIKDWAKSVNYNPVIMLTCQTRLSIYENCINMIKSHPFVGVGINTFSKSYGQYRTPRAESRFHTPATIYAHNNFLQMAGEVGLLGLIVFWLFLFVVLRQAWAAFKEFADPFLKGLSVSVFAAIITYLINGLTETSLYHSRLVVIFWFLVGLALALKNSLHTKAIN